MDQNNQSYLATEKIGKSMVKYAVPCITSLLVGALYNRPNLYCKCHLSRIIRECGEYRCFSATVISLAIAVL